jgi:hypothetical protein
MTSRPLGGKGYQGFCDDSTKALVIKSVTMVGRGVKNNQKLRDVIYGRPFNHTQLYMVRFFHSIQINSSIDIINITYIEENE